MGAGILGVSSAFYLKKNNPGKKVLLVDRYPSAAQGNTARSNAMFRNTFSSFDNQVLADTSINYYLSLSEDVGVRKTGYLWLMGDEQLSRNAKHIKKMAANGIEINVHSRSELEHTIPSLNLSPAGEESELLGLENISGAVFGPKCGRIDPEKLANHYLKSFLNIGGLALFNTRVESLCLSPEKPLGIEGEPFTWQESQVSGMNLSGEVTGTLTASKIVLACGAWTNVLLEPLGIDGHVKAKKRQLFKIRAKADSKLTQLIANKHFNRLEVLPFLILPKSGCFVKAIMENGEFWIGCDDDLGRPFINTPSENLDDYRAESKYFEGSVYPILKSYLPEFVNMQPSQMWAGLYSYNTLDFIPFVFEEGNVIAVGGDSGSGIMKADALGRIVDSLYRKGEYQDADLFGGTLYSPEKLGFRNRRVEKEEWVL
ncbi:MAG: NAD(P)/FAD-dependent oxidoreductase [Nitrososphaerales archaeon]